MGRKSFAPSSLTHSPPPPPENNKRSAPPNNVSANYIQQELSLAFLQRQVILAETVCFGTILAFEKSVNTEYLVSAEIGRPVKHYLLGTGLGVGPQCTTLVSHPPSLFLSIEASPAPSLWGG